jgi:hypothetical protein
VYQDIIKDVIEHSRVDFEEAGVDGLTLEELQSVSAALPLFMPAPRYF